MTDCHPTPPADTPPTPAASPLDPGRRGRLALAVAAAVDGVVGARRTGGTGVEVATQYPGGRVVGVKLGATEVTVHIAAGRFPLDVLADSVRAAARTALGGFGERQPVAVVIDDIDVPALPSVRVR